MFIRTKKSPQPPRQSLIIVHNVREAGKKNCSQRTVKSLGTSGCPAEQAKLYEQGLEWIAVNGSQWIAENCPLTAKKPLKNKTSEAKTFEPATGSICSSESTLSKF
jgi:hypothetical protein